MRSGAAASAGLLLFLLCANANRRSNINRSEAVVADLRRRYGGVKWVRRLDAVAWITLWSVRYSSLIQGREFTPGRLSVRHLLILFKRQQD